MRGAAGVAPGDALAGAAGGAGAATAGRGAIVGAVVEPFEGALTVGVGRAGSPVLGGARVGAGIGGIGKGRVIAASRCGGGLLVSTGSVPCCGRAGIGGGVGVGGGELCGLRTGCAFSRTAPGGFIAA